MIHKRVAWWFALMAVLALPLEAASDVRVTWAKLPELVTGRKITLVTKSGATLRGRVEQVTQDRLVLRGGKAGPTEVPRAGLTTFEMKTSGAKWKIIGAAIGAGVGIAGAVPVNAYAHNEGDGAPLVVAAIVAVPAALGFLMGWMADHKTVTVTVRD
jgi:hypothetical protein